MLGNDCNFSILAFVSKFEAKQKNSIAFGSVTDIELRSYSYH